MDDLVKKDYSLSNVINLRQAMITVAALAARIDRLETELRSAYGDRQQYRLWGERLVEILDQSPEVVLIPHYWDFPRE